MTTMRRRDFLSLLGFGAAGATLAAATAEAQPAIEPAAAPVPAPVATPIAFETNLETFSTRAELGRQGYRGVAVDDPDRWDAGGGNDIAADIRRAIADLSPPRREAWFTGVEPFPELASMGTPIVMTSDTVARVWRPGGQADGILVGRNMTWDPDLGLRSRWLVSLPAPDAMPTWWHELGGPDAVEIEGQRIPTSALRSEPKPWVRELYERAIANPEPMRPGHFTTMQLADVYDPADDDWDDEG